MKMADSEKTEEFVDAESFPECPSEGGSTAAAVGGGERDEGLKTETTTTTTSSPPGEKESDSPLQAEGGEPGLLSMPCLMKELRRDSPEPQHASTGSDKPAAARAAYESDSSNPCMLSPSSSGHLADSDTLSSGEDGARGAGGRGAGGREAGGGAEGGADLGTAVGGQVAAASGGGRKSRRSRSESEMSTPNMMGAKKNRCQPSAFSAAVATGGAGPEKQTNGRLAKVKGHRSQKHKERMRLLRQKREAAARKKYNLLQDSSTSDSDLTCDSSSSSSDDDDDEAAGGKTINTDIPDGPPVVGHYDISDSDSNLESRRSLVTIRTSVIRQEIKTLRDQDVRTLRDQDVRTLRDQDVAVSGAAGGVRVLSSLPDQMEAELSHRASSQLAGQITLASSDSEVEIIGVQENTRCGHPRGGVIQSLSSWKPPSVEPFGSPRPGQLWTTVTPQPNWVTPPEVVDLTLDEDTRHKYLL